MGLHFNFREGLSWHKPEQHNIDKVALWNTGADIGDPVHADVLVSQESALRLSVVYRCITLIAGTLAALPADAVRARGEIRQDVPRPPRWLDFPNPEATWFEFAERIFESLAMDGNGFVLVTARDSMGFPAELWTLHPREVEVRKRNGKIFFVWNGSEEFSRYSVGNPTGDVLHIKLSTAGGLRGLSPLEMARQSIGLGLAAEKFGAKFYGRGQTLSGVIQLPAANGPQTAEHINLIRENWEAKHGGTDKAHRPGVLTGGATWQGISITNEQAQFLETRLYQNSDIASRIYGVPSHMVGLEEKNTSWGTGIEAQSTGFLRFTLLPWIVRFESAMSQLLPRGQQLKLNQRGMLRADTKTETEVLVAQVMNGLRTRNEGRALLDEPPAPGGDRFILPLNMQILTGAGATEPAPVPTPVTPSVEGDGNEGS